MQEIHNMLQEILARLDKIESQLTKPRVANINRYRKPKFEVVKNEE